MECYLDPELMNKLQYLVNGVVDLFVLKYDCQLTNENKHQVRIRFAKEMGDSFEDLIGHFLISRISLLPEIITASGFNSLIYLFGPSHTSPSPDHCEWGSRKYSFSMNSYHTLEQLHVKSNGSIKNLAIQVPIEARDNCTWDDLESCRGKLWKNDKNAAGPDLVLIDGKPNSKLIIGVDAKSSHRSKRQLATQFIQSLASSPPVAVLFSICCRNDAKEMYRINEGISSIYSEVYKELRSENDERFPHSSFDELMKSVGNFVGVKPCHILLGNEFFGPTISNLFKIYHSVFEEEERSNAAVN
ncbi:hypothetical protein P9112_007022 [Eukaryota sp. TZLM1-RC]